MYDNFRNSLPRSPTKSNDSDQSVDEIDAMAELGNVSMKEENETGVIDDKLEGVVLTVGNTEDIEMSSSEWKSGLSTKPMSKDQMEGAIVDSDKWYTFLEDLQSVFYEYYIQKERERYNVYDIYDWSRPEKRQGLSVSSKNLNMFFKKIKRYRVKEYWEIERKLNTITDSQIEELNQVLNITLNYQLTIRCSEPDIHISGSFVVLGEAMHNLKTNSDTNDSCKNFEADLAEGKYNWFKVFALNRVFINTDLPFSGKNISVAIIAPRWEIVFPRSIDLSGQDGPPPDSPKAKNGPLPGNDGRAGSPGNPGEYGKSFFGIGSTFVEGENLMIISNGGKGGKGQDGGDGLKGKDGKDAIKPSLKDEKCSNNKFREFECVEWRGKGSIATLTWTEVTYYLIKGVAAGFGGGGGHGGKGGHGGFPGNITVLELGHPSEISRDASNGAEGENGRGGAGAPRGKDAKDVKAEYRYTVDFQHAGTFKNWMEIEEIAHPGVDLTLGHGKNGSDGGNTKDMKVPEQAKDTSQRPYIINEFKVFSRENTKKRFQKRALLQFFDLLDGNEDVRKLYDINALLAEFLDLEKQFAVLGEDVDFAPFYRSLLARVGAFATDQKDVSGENKKILNYLYTAALGRIHYLKEKTEQNLIIDIRKYLNVIEGNILTLKDLQKQSNKMDVINKYKDQYKNDINEKIRRAHSIVKQELMPEMDDIRKEVDKEITALVDETIEATKKAEKDYEKENEKKKELQDALVTKGVFNCFKFVGQTLTILGPYGEMANAIISGGSDVIQSLKLRDEEKILKIPSNVESSLKTLKKQIEIMREEKTDNLDTILTKVSEEIGKKPEELGDLKTEVEEMKKKLKKVKDKELDFKEVGEIKKNLDKKIEEKQLDIKQKQERDPDKVDLIENIAKIAEFGSFWVNIYKDIKGDGKKIDQVIASMEAMGDKIKALMDYEKEIYNSTGPMLQEMLDNMDDVSSKLDAQSQIELDVTKWKVQKYLKDMKIKMAKITEGKGVKDDLGRSIEKLEEVVVTLVNIYDRIQSYQEQQNLANYIADISSDASSRIDIQNITLINAVNHLEFAIRSNLVLDQYKSAIVALKQWTFPYTDEYIVQDMLPSHLQMKQNMENLVDTAVKKVGKIKEKIHLHDASLKGHGKYIRCGVFSSRYSSTPPFYKWKNEENRLAISNLFSGKKVTLRADVYESPPRKDAIKFSEIIFDFVFKSKNETRKSSLHELLKGFHIYATHLGNSYYRYHNKITLIQSENVTISYSYEKDEYGNRLDWNYEYVGLQGGDLMLSPYTLWEVRMISQGLNYTFTDLVQFKDDVDIELSGIGSYIDVNMIDMIHGHQAVRNGSFALENETIPAASSPLGVNWCTRNRRVRSVKGNELYDGFSTNSASKGLSSPINFFLNFLKTYFGTNLLISFNHALFGKQSPVTRDSSDFPPNDCVELRTFDPTNVQKPEVTDTDATSVENENDSEKIERRPDICVNIKLGENNNCLKPLLLSGEKPVSPNRSTNVPDLNCSLLLADLLTRTVTGNKYKTPIAGNLLSARERIFGKISDAAIQNERDVKRLLYYYQSEVEEKRPSPWFGKLYGYAKSMLEYVGFVENFNTEEYIQDVRHLFA